MILIICFIAFLPTFLYAVTSKFIRLMNRNSSSLIQSIEKEYPGYKNFVNKKSMIWITLSIWLLLIIAIMFINPPYASFIILGGMSFIVLVLGVEILFLSYLGREKLIEYRKSHPFEYTKEYINKSVLPVRIFFSVMMIDAVLNLILEAWVIIDHFM
ncbi:hypothetical protein [Lentilactobacillus kribbianus]|uniref:hypothetical protein n=1 Tax=Lentilactobacillus kribbianus TaxID=2729622 RepID=UPI0015533BE8|nr:hypothetical protein [Lentilactobacillus kribbianus]